MLYIWLDWFRRLVWRFGFVRHLAGLDIWLDWRFGGLIWVGDSAGSGWISGFVGELAGLDICLFEIWLSVAGPGRGFCWLWRFGWVVDFGGL